MTERAELEEILRSINLRPNLHYTVPVGAEGDYQSLETHFMRWHNRHSGRPSKERVAECLRTFFEGYASTSTGSVRGIQQIPAGTWEGLADRVFALYSYPESHEQKKVTREEIENFLKDIGIFNYDVPGGIPVAPPVDTVYRFKIVEDLLALLNGEPEKRWCVHMVWNESISKYRCVYPLNEISDFMTEQWKVCPLCSTPRPR